MPTRFNTGFISAMTDLLIEGLEMDGVFHKQWYLEEILKLLVGKDEFEDLKNKLSWEPGITP